MKTSNHPSQNPVLGRLFSNPQVWMWSAIILSVLVCGSISWIHFRQRQVIGQTISALDNIRQARIELAKGFLYTSLAGDPALPFNRDQGLTLLQQAIPSLEGALRWSGRDTANLDPAGAESMTAFRNSVRVFRDRLAEWSETAAPQPGLVTDLRIAFYDLERQADRIDASPAEFARAFFPA